MRSFAAVVACVVILGLATSARAGGYELGTDQGGEGVGRAGATTAYSNFMAMYTNIAGIADTPRYAIYLTDSMTFRRLAFTRTPVPSRTTMGGEIPEHAYETAEDTTGVFPIGLGLAAHIRLSEYLVLGLAVNGPTSIGWGNYDGPEYVADAARDSDGNWINSLRGGARFDLTHMDILFLWPSVGLGLTVPGYENLRIGFSFSPQFAHLTFVTFADAGGNGEVETELSMWDSFIPAGQIGVMWRLWRFDLGLQVRISDDIEAEGEGDSSVELTVYDPDTGSDDAVEASAGGATFTSPWPRAVLRFGIRYAHPLSNPAPGARMPWQRELFDIEFDVVYENTSQAEGFSVTLSDVELGGAPAVGKSLFVRHDWQDTLSLRLGGSVHLLRGMLSIHAGASWESATVPENFTRLDYASWGRVGLAMGVTLRVSIVEISLAYQHIFMADRNVEPLTEEWLDNDENEPCDVRACSLNAIDPTVPTNDVINTGLFEGSYDIVTLSVAFRWGEGSQARPGDASGGAPGDAVDFEDDSDADAMMNEVSTDDDDDGLSASNIGGDMAPPTPPAGDDEAMGDDVDAEPVEEAPAF